MSKPRNETLRAVEFDQVEDEGDAILLHLTYTSPLRRNGLSVGPQTLTVPATEAFAVEILDLHDQVQDLLHRYLNLFDSSPALDPADDGDASEFDIPEADVIARSFQPPMTRTFTD